jgi:hypothetical protein
VLIRGDTIDRQDGMIDAKGMRDMHVVREVVTASGFRLRGTHRKSCHCHNGCKDEGHQSSWNTTGELPKTRLNSLQEIVPDVVAEENSKSST